MLAVSMLLFACGGSEPEPSPDSGDAEIVDPDAPGVREVGPNHYTATLYAYDGGYRPSEIRVPVGAELTIRAQSRDQPHGFMIEGTDVELDIYPGEFVEATHTFTEPGEHRFFCHVYCGASHDAMRGRVIVE